MQHKRSYRILSTIDWIQQTEHAAKPKKHRTRLLKMEAFAETNQTKPNFVSLISFQNPPAASQANEKKENYPQNCPRASLGSRHAG
jgi:hypothetical protein